MLSSLPSQRPIPPSISNIFTPPIVADPQPALRSTTVNLTHDNLLEKRGPSYHPCGVNLMLLTDSKETNLPNSRQLCPDSDFISYPYSPSTQSWPRASVLIFKSSRLAARDHSEYQEQHLFPRVIAQYSRARV